MRRVGAIIACFLVAAGCTDDQVELRRGPLAPATYEVGVRATTDEGDVQEARSATLRVTNSPRGTLFALSTGAGEVIDAEVRRLEDGSVTLERVRGAPVGTSRETELASLVGQLDPPLPAEPVRLQETWSSTQRISTRTLTASLTTELRIVRFRRLDSTDAAELQGDITGRIRTSGRGGVNEGTLSGTTRIVWGVVAGRVVESDTDLLWRLRSGGDVRLETSVRPS